MKHDEKLDIDSKYHHQLKGWNRDSPTKGHKKGKAIRRFRLEKIDDVPEEKILRLMKSKNGLLSNSRQSKSTSQDSNYPSLNKRASHRRRA